MTDVAKGQLVLHGIHVWNDDQGKEIGRTLFYGDCYLNTISSQNAGQPFVLGMKRLFRSTSVNKAVFTVDA